MVTLAEFIQQKRENLGLSAIGLAKKANLDLAFLEDLESGRELFLSVPQRQKLARILKCSPEELKNLEKSFEFQVISDDIIDTIKQKILNNEKNLKCPMCGEPLITRIAKMYDIEDNLILQPKAHCVKCVFQIKD